MSGYIDENARIADDIHNAYEEGYADGKRDAVVRCKDCKHSDTFPVCGEPYSFPLKCLSVRYGGVFENWFCEHGERR